MLILGANIFRWYVKNVGLPEIPKGDYIDKSWDDFIADCGFRSYLGNPIHASSAFYTSYSRSTVIWTGRVNKIQEGFFSKNFLFVTMSPSQFPPDIGRSSPDLALMFSKTLDNKIVDVHLEDQIHFETTLLEL
eukprot:CAMPEP_0113856856 /NCGR_PEP_ID=MMETSP0372-20130328/9602_1 /TAXON_ID=340204 /ORGANISM="Lankesteria abbotti" /LENGTH=132 /DNA_ID=CAMNT_0000832171 /DNA_START=220 /DNA_END=614 /DNA_ORIENTATION=- /assembly_acc=CAM_ASM_000359